MRRIKQDTYKGTQILVGNEKRSLIRSMVDILIDDGFQEIIIPNIQYSKLFENKVGDENMKMMYTFQDLGGRDLCLAPEYTAVVQNLAKQTFKFDKDVKLFYVQECFRGERPQAGRYRQFTQLGVEILNPKSPMTLYPCLINLAQRLIQEKTSEFNIDAQVSRGLDYYEKGMGFEISCDSLGSSKQVCGGGKYDGGMGFAIGIDRLLLTK